MVLLSVAIGGAIGSCARYLVAAALTRHATPPSVIGTFAVNMIGCLAFGIIAALMERRFAMNPSARAFLLIGVLGGFTTFSSYTYETFVLLEQSQFVRAGVNAGGQVVGGLVALWCGYAAVRMVM